MADGITVASDGPDGLCTGCRARLAAWRPPALPSVPAPVPRRRSAVLEARQAEAARKAARFCQLIDSGLSVTAAARQAGVSTTTGRKYLKDRIAAGDAA